MNRKIITAKQFRLPLEEALLNRVYNDPDCVIEIEQVFQDKTGDVTVFLKYRKYETSQPNNEESEDIYEDIDNYLDAEGFFFDED